MGSFEGYSKVGVQLHSDQRVLLVIDHLQITLGDCTIGKMCPATLLCPPLHCTYRARKPQFLKATPSCALSTNYPHTRQLAYGQILNYT